MQSLHLSALEPEFSFAGFSWPKYLSALPRGDKQARIKRRSPAVCGQYYSAPKPVSWHGFDHGYSFYLDSDFMVGRDWEWCDDVSRIRHKGWYFNDYQDTIRGIVVSLPHGLFLAGWSMGKGMASAVYRVAFSDKVEAALMADEYARVAADNQREYEEKEALEESEDNGD